MSAEIAPEGEADSSTDATDKEFSCPTCDRSGFKSRSGVKIHHSKIHDESIAGVKVSCDFCGDDFSLKAYRVRKYENKFCSEKCQGDYYREERKPREAPTWKGGKVTKECQICGDEFKSYPHRNKKLCSRECHGKHTSQRQSGENHHNWKGGKATYYGKNWQQQRDKARERDRYECQDCGVTEKELDRELDVHHIKPVRVFKDKYNQEWWKKANRLENLVCFCQTCHKKWEGIPLRPQTD